MQHFSLKFGALSISGTQPSNKFISKNKTFQITVRKQTRYQSLKPHSVNRLGFHAPIYIYIYVIIETLHTFFFQIFTVDKV